MKNLVRKISSYLGASKARRNAARVLALVVVFATTYSLVLPAITMSSALMGELDGVKVRVEADEGALHFGTSLVLKEVLLPGETAAEELAAVMGDIVPELPRQLTKDEEARILEAALNGDPTMQAEILKVMDISLEWNGQETEPLQPVRLVMQSDLIKEANRPVIVHLGDDGIAELAAEFNGIDEAAVYWEPGEFAASEEPVLPEGVVPEGAEEDGETEGAEGAEQSGETDEAGESEQPGETADPETFEQPGETVNPETSEQPEMTADPETSEQPGETVNSETSEQPGETADPETSEQPGETVSPETPEQPEMTVPVEDVTPEEPVQPEVTAPVEDFVPEEPEQFTEPEPVDSPSDTIAADVDSFSIYAIVDLWSIYEEQDVEMEEQDTETEEQDVETEEQNTETEEQDVETEEQDVETIEFTDTIGDVDVYVTAPVTAFPEGTTMKLALVDPEEVIDAVAEAIDETESEFSNEAASEFSSETVSEFSITAVSESDSEAVEDENGVTVIRAVDITFINAEGKEIEPSEPINVVMQTVAIKDTDNSVLVHIGETETSVVEGAAFEKAQVSFDSDAFSIYAVAVKTSSTTTSTLGLDGTITLEGSNPRYTTYEHTWTITSETSEEVVEIVSQDLGTATLKAVREGVATVNHHYQLITNKNFQGDDTWTVTVTSTVHEVDVRAEETITLNGGGEGASNHTWKWENYIKADNYLSIKGTGFTFNETTGYATTPDNTITLEGKNTSQQFKTYTITHTWDGGAEIFIITVKPRSDSTMYWDWDVANLTIGSTTSSAESILDETERNEQRGLVHVKVVSKDGSESENFKSNGDYGTFTDEGMVAAEWGLVSTNSYSPNRGNVGDTVIITTDPGYYIANIGVLCDQLSPAKGPDGKDNDGLACEVFSRGQAYTVKGDISQLKVTIDTNEFYNHAPDKQLNANYDRVMHILVDVRESPWPAYVQYDAGEVGGKSVAEAPEFQGKDLVTSKHNRETDFNGTNQPYRVTYIYSEEEIKSTTGGSMHTVLQPSTNVVTVNNTLYRFTGWNINLYKEYSDTPEEEAKGYPKGTMYDHAEAYGDDIEAGHQIQVQLHVKLTAQWEAVPAGLMIVKDIDGDLSKEDLSDKVFHFTLTDESENTETITISEANEWSWVDANIKPGTYTITEDTIAAGIDDYNLSVANKVSRRSNGQEEENSTHVSSTNDRAKVTIAKGQVVTVTFTNTYEVEEKSYKLEIYKVGSDTDGALLAGAEFKLYSFDSEGAEEYLYSSEAPLVSTDDGPLVIEGLIIGQTYYLKETKAPDGYLLMFDPVEFTVDKAAEGDGIVLTVTGSELAREWTAGTDDPDVAVYAIQIVNQMGTPLPRTGGMGTGLYTLGGLSLMGAGLLALLLKKKGYGRA